MSSNPWQKMDGHADHYESALRAALDDLDRERRDADAARKWLREAEGRVADLTVLVKHLYGVLPVERQAVFSERVTDLQVNDAQSNNRSTPVYDNVVDLFTRQKKEWTVAEVHAALASNGVGADPKAIYNVVNYLARKGRLRRVAKGQYVWVDGGVGIHVDEDIAAVDQNGRTPMED